MPHVSLRGPSRRQLLLLGVAVSLSSGFAQAAQPPVNTLKNSFFGGRTDTAINGYDTVAYFTVGKPVQRQGQPGSRMDGREVEVRLAGAPGPVQGRPRRSTRRSTAATAPTAWRRTTW